VAAGAGAVNDLGLPTALLGNHERAMRRAGLIAPCSPIVSGTGFSAQLIEEHDTETDVPALENGVFIQVLSRRPTVWTDLLGRKHCHDTPANSFVYVPKDCASWWHVRNCGGPMLHMLLDTDRLRTLGVMEDLPLPGGEPPPSIGWCDAMLASLTHMLTAEMASPQRSALLIDTLALTIEIALLRRSGGKTVSPPKSGGLAGWQLRRTTDYLDTHLADDISLAELAAIADLSPHHFCRAFKQSTGLPPHAWLTARRIERAQDLMAAHPKMGLTEVALCVGYQSQAAFGVAFRRATGVTPGQWRRERAR